MPDNTRMNYLYRDADNYKYCHFIVVKGRLTFADLEPFLDNMDGDGFCPHDVGLPHPGQMEGARGFPGSSDHVWCELTEYDFEATEDPGEISAKELIARFKRAHSKGWPAQTRDVEEIYS